MKELNKYIARNIHHDSKNHITPLQGLTFVFILYPGFTRGYSYCTTTVGPLLSPFRVPVILVVLVFIDGK